MDENATWLKKDENKALFFFFLSEVLANQPFSSFQKRICVYGGSVHTLSEHDDYCSHWHHSKVGPTPESLDSNYMLRILSHAPTVKGYEVVKHWKIKIWGHHQINYMWSFHAVASNPTAINSELKVPRTIEETNHMGVTMHPQAGWKTFTCKEITSLERTEELSSRQLDVSPLWILSNFLDD